MVRSAVMAELADDGCAVEDVVTLLSSPKRKFLQCGKGYKVPISELKNKVIGLYFYTHWTNEDEFLKLKRMCKEVRKIGENFQLVFICIHHPPVVTKRCLTVEKTFRKYFKGTTWLALPFSHRKSNLKLYDMFSSLGDPYDGAQLVIIRPGENIAHTYAMEIYSEYGIQAYPFTKSRVTDLEVARLKSLTLDSVLFTDEDHKYVLGQDGQQIPASDLVGKNILIFLTTQPFEDFGDDDPVVRRDKLIYEKVISWYNEIKHKDETFEMVRVFYMYNPRLEEGGENCNGKMPWLEFPYDKHDMEAIYHNLLQTIGDTINNIPMFVAFGRDGQFITLKRLGTLIDSGKDDDDCPNFFDDVLLYRDVHEYIANTEMWSLEDEKTQRSFLQRCSDLQRKTTEDEETQRSSLQRCSVLLDEES